MEITFGILIPFLGTSIGALMVFFMKNNLNPKVEKILLGFASGVMIATSIWSLLIPAINMAEKQEKIAWIPAVVGFILGIAFLLIIDTLVPHLEGGKRKGIKIHSHLTCYMKISSRWMWRTDAQVPSHYPTS